MVQIQVSVELGVINKTRPPTGHIDPDQIGTGSNSRKVFLHIPQSSRTGSIPSNSVSSHIGTFVRGGVLLLYRGAVDVFYSPSRQGGLLISYIIVFTSFVCLLFKVLIISIITDSINITMISSDTD